MNTLPRVAQWTREKVAREFDDLGPDLCVAEISAHLRKYNPEWLSMAAKCAGGLGNPRRAIGGFCMFYRLLIAQASPDHMPTIARNAQLTLSPLPRVSAATRAAIVAALDGSDAETFLFDAIAELGTGNPELLQMADYFASANGHYLGLMQGFALLYSALLIQSGTDNLFTH